MADPMFFKPASRMTMGDIAEITGASLRDPQLAPNVFVKLAALDNAGEGDITFIENKKYADRLSGLKVAGIFCPQELASQVPSNVAAFITKNPHKDFAALARHLYPTAVMPGPWTGEDGVSAAAFVHPEAVLEDNVTVEAGAVVGKGAVIGSGTLISAGAIVGEYCTIGRQSYIGPGTSVQHAMIGNRVLLHPGVRVGQDGFGYLPGAAGLEKIPQLGRVIIQDDVEVGSNTTIDRGALSDTIIGEGTKIDNLVQIAHNVRIGRFCVIAAHCGISGSVTIGDMTMLGGRVGLADHLVIGSRVQIAAASGVMNDIPDGEKWGGLPARPIKQWFREVATLRSFGLHKKD